MSSIASLAALPPSKCKAGFVSHEKYYWHDSGLESDLPGFQPRGSIESAEGKRRIENLLRVTPLWDELVHVKPRLATDAEILAFHTQRYLSLVKEVSSRPGGGKIGHELHLGRGGFEIAALSAGGVLAAVEAAVAGTIKSAYCLVRPPGHHADADGGHGFCVFSNVSLAAAHALNSLGLSRVAVVDWDVHHGNGTQNHFYGSNACLFISLHQEGLYPLTTGAVDETGEGEGRGYNLNVPLPPGCGAGAYFYAFERIVLPALRAYRPQLILVSSGFDSCFLDPLGRMLLRACDYRALTRALMTVAEEVGAVGPIIAHEGGYNPSYTPFCGVAVVEELTGLDAGVTDPFCQDVGPEKWVALQPHQAAAVDAAARNLELALLPPAGAGKA